MKYEVLKVKIERSDYQQGLVDFLETRSDSYFESLVTSEYDRTAQGVVASGIFEVDKEDIEKYEKDPNIFDRNTRRQIACFVKEQDKKN